jgi:opine dehydrogenase
VRTGLSFIASVADLAAVPAPLACAFLAIGGAVVGEDFMVTGRTLKGMGLGQYDKAGLQRLLADGFGR